MSIFDEEAIPIRKAGDYYPNGPIHSTTVDRHALHGVGPRKIKLESYKSGGRRYTSKEAIMRFVIACSDCAEEGSDLDVSFDAESWGSDPDR